MNNVVNITKQDQYENGYVKNCIINAKEGETAFSIDTKGKITPYLDGYAIIPVEEYERLNLNSNTEG